MSPTRACSRAWLLCRSALSVGLVTAPGSRRTAGGRLHQDRLRSGPAGGSPAFKPNTEERWYAFMDESSGRGYIPFTTRELDNPGWSTPDDYDLPDRSRPGTVLSVTKAELNRIRAAIPPATSISANEHRLTPDDRAISWLFA